LLLETSLQQGQDNVFSSKNTKTGWPYRQDQNDARKAKFATENLRDVFAAV
jgi:hypothetical protein